MDSDWDQLPEGRDAPWGTTEDPPRGLSPPAAGSPAHLSGGSLPTPPKPPGAAAVGHTVLPKGLLCRPSPSSGNAGEGATALELANQQPAAAWLLLCAVIAWRRIIMAGEEKTP